MKRLGVAAIFLLLPFLAGCMTATPGLDGISYQLEQDLAGVRFEPEMGLKLGRVSMLLTRSLAGARVEDDEGDRIASEILRGLKKVEVASYRTVALGRKAAEEGTLQGLRRGRFERSLHRSGWKTLARVTEDDESVWVAYRGPEDRIRQLLVVVLEEEEMELIRLTGHLDRALQAAFQIAFEPWEGKGSAPPSESPPGAQSTAAASGL